MTSPYIRHIYTLAEMDALLSAKSLVVVGFHATWSAPCHKIASFYSRLAAKHRTLTFVKVKIDADNVHSVAQKCRLIELPTFIMIENEEEIDRVCGADPKGLEAMIHQHAPEAKPTTKDAGSADVNAVADESLLEYLDMRKVTCSNEARHHPLKSIAEKKRQNTTDAYLESDGNEQLLINLFFNQDVKVRSLVLHSKDPKFGPKKIKIDINKVALGLNVMKNAAETAVIQVLEVPEEVVKEGKPIRLRFKRFKRVTSLHIFVESNHGNEDVTRIDALDVYGQGHGEPATTAQLLGPFDFLGPLLRGMELLKLFKSEGGRQNLSTAVSLIRESLLLCPDDREVRTGLAANLAGALLSQYVYRGHFADLSEASVLFHETLELCPSGHPDRAASLINFAHVLRIRYRLEGSLSDLEEAIEMQREAHSLIPPGHPDRAVSFNNLANALYSRYEHEGSLLDLGEAIEKHRGALNFYLPGDPDRAGSLSNLANALLMRYKRAGSLLDLEEAIEMQREALNLRLPDHPDRAESLHNLANALLSRYQREGSLSDLGEIIEMQREALNLRPPGHPERPASLNNLAQTLRIRYDREGSLSDLEEAMEQLREALSLSLPGHSGRAVFLINLATVLHTRYERQANLSDLEESIEQHRRALDLRPSGHPDRPASLTTLATVLLTRHRREGSVPDLEEAIEMQRESLNLIPPGSLDRALSLNNLANALCTRGESEGCLSDLEEAIEMQREALGLHLPGSPGHTLSLNNLANALISRYERIESLSDLEEATEHYEKALELHPHGHPDRSDSLISLALAYLLVINGKDGTSTTQDQRALVDKVFNLLREAVNHSNSPPLRRLRAALHWIDASNPLAPGSVLDAYSAALDQLDIVLTTYGTLTSKHSQLSSGDLLRYKQLGVEAASCAVRQGNMILAVEFLERGRNLLFAQIGRYRVELEELEKENAKLAKRFYDLSSLLDSSVMSNQPAVEGETVFEDSIARYRRVALDWDRAVNDIRAMPGFESFLRPPHYTALRAAAAEGPIVIVIPDDGQSHALIILQGRDTPYHVGLPKASEGELVTLCNDFIRAVRSDDEDDADSRITALLRSLWVCVVGPIADSLDNKLHCPPYSRVWWCPSSHLSFLPLHAAGCYAANANPNWNFPAKYVSSYTPTLQALSRARSKHSGSKDENMLIVAQPDTPGYDPLPSALPEARVVEALAKLKMGMKATLLSSKEGTHAAVLNRMVNHSWIHLICHGSQGALNPFDSCFHLYDKKLTLRDIMQRGLPDAKFAFLAACHTATGDIELLDEGLHLAAGLQFSGFRSVVGTIWEVADSDGPMIAGAFYKALQRERPEEEGIDCRRAAHALSEAVKYLRDNGVPISRWIRHIHIGI